MFYLSKTHIFSEFVNDLWSIYISNNFMINSNKKEDADRGDGTQKASLERNKGQARHTYSDTVTKITVAKEI